MSSMESMLRSQREKLVAELNIVEEALKKYAALNSTGAAAPEAKPKDSEVAELNRAGYDHPTLGHIPIDRDHPRWATAWQFEVERILKAIKDNPGAYQKELAAEADLSGGQASGVLRFLEAEGTIEAEREVDRLQANRPRKTYRIADKADAKAIVKDAEEARAQKDEKPKPKQKPKQPSVAQARQRRRRRQTGQAGKKIIQAIEANPGITTTELLQQTKLAKTTLGRNLKALIEVKRIVKIPGPNPTSASRYEMATQDPMRPQPKGKEREVKVAPGEGVSLGRLKGTTIGGN